MLYFYSRIRGTSELVNGYGSLFEDFLLPDGITANTHNQNWRVRPTMTIIKERIAAEIQRQPILDQHQRTLLAQCRIPAPVAPVLWSAPAPVAVPAHYAAYAAAAPAHYAAPAAPRRYIHEEAILYSQEQKKKADKEMDEILKRIWK